MTGVADLKRRAEPVAINDLPRHFPGDLVLARCFGGRQAPRDESAVKAEYDGDKYRALLDILSAEDRGETDPFRLRMAEFRHDPNAAWCFSIGEALYRAPLREVQLGFDRLLVEEVLDAARHCPTVVELGCGYGYNLWIVARQDSSKHYLGGDLAPTAIEIGRRLFGEHGPRVQPFNFYEDAGDLLDEAEGPILVFTCHSIEQLPGAGHAIDELARHVDKIAGVLHFEPLFGSFGRSLLGRLRAAHAEALDYNRDLLGVLEGRHDVHVATCETNVVGINPLNPSSIVRWHFA